MQLTNEMLMKLQREEITFGAFARSVHGDITALATSLMKKRTTVPCVEVDDVVQEMFLAVFTHVPRWQPGKAPIKSYIVFVACAAATDFLKRNAHQKERDVQCEVPSDRVLPAHEFDLDIERTLQRLPVGERQAVILHSVAETQCIDRTTDELMHDPRTRAMFATDRNSVRRGVYRTVETLTHRAQAMV